MRLGVRLLDLVLRPSSIAHFRTVLGVASKFPAIGRAFYEAGPEFGRKRLAAHLDAQVEAGVLDTDDTEAAAVHFIEDVQVALPAPGDPGSERPAVRGGDPSPRGQGCRRVSAGLHQTNTLRRQDAAAVRRPSPAAMASRTPASSSNDFSRAW